MHPLTTDLAEQILALVKIEAYSLLGAIQDGKTVLGGSAGSGGGTGDPPAGFVGQLTQSNVTFDTAGSSRACSAGSAGSSSLVDNLDAIRLGIEICDDAIGDRHIDWGHGAGQVDAEDVPLSSGSFSSTNVHDALEELYGVSAGSAADHGTLTGLADDDHTQYLLADGTRALTGPWDVGANLVTFGAGITLDGASAANVITVPDNVAQALNLVDVGGLEYVRVVSTDANPYLCFFPAGGGNVGIGTATIPHGGIGAAMLALEGVNASALAGPYVQCTTAADDYPLLQILPYTHDVIYISLDAYYDAAWRSADAGSNCALVKTQDLFRIRYDSGVAQGAALTWKDALVVDLTTGDIGVGTGPEAQLNLEAGPLQVGMQADATWVSVTANDLNFHRAGASYISQLIVGGEIRVRVSSAAPADTTAMTIASSGNVGSGTTGPNAKIESLATTEQLRLSYDVDSYTSFTVAADSDLTITPAESGQVIIQPTTDSTTFFQVLDADGGVPVLNVDTTNERVGISQSAPGGKLQINQGDAGGAIPTLVLTQSDVDMDFIRVFGTAAAADLTRSIVDEGDQASETRGGWLKVYVVDYGNQITDQAYFIPIYTLSA